MSSLMDMSEIVALVAIAIALIALQFVFLA
jgi:hypothetical protein